MTHKQFLELTSAQKQKLFEVFHRRGTPIGINYVDWLEQFTSAPTALSNYVGVEWCGMFLGIEPDGYCHS